MGGEAFWAEQQLFDRIELAPEVLNEADSSSLDSSVCPESRTLSGIETVQWAYCLRVVEFGKAQLGKGFAARAKPYL